MESGSGMGMETTNLPLSLGSLLSSVGQLLLLGLEWILAHCPGFAVAAGAGALVGSGKRLIMKVIIFPVKFDKFTGFFDKSDAFDILSRFHRRQVPCNLLKLFYLFIFLLRDGIRVPQSVIKPKADSLQRLRIPGSRCRRSMVSDGVDAPPADITFWRCGVACPCRGIAQHSCKIRFAPVVMRSGGTSSERMNA